MRRILLVFAGILLVSTAFSQKLTVSGYVEDRASGERLIGAAVFVKGTNYGTLTNEYGYFSLTVPVKQARLTVSYVGYHPVDTLITKPVDGVVFRLSSATVLEEVVVTGYKNELKSPQMGRVSVPVKMVQNIPMIFGEGDLMKALQLLPGVQSGTEGTGGIYVRGGGPDQNLILLDGVPVYNLNHMFGFFSVFTPEAIKDVTLIKGGFPAHYGGRLSSVVDIRMKDGNMDHLTGSVSVGLISSKFTVEGPIQKGKTSFIISARRTYYDMLARPFIAKFGSQESTDNTTYVGKSSFNAGYYFYDVYAKVNHKFSGKDRVYLSFYSGLDRAFVKYKDDFHFFGDDMFEFRDIEETEGDLHWGNSIVAFRWNHSFGSKLFSNMTLTYSRFVFSNGFDSNFYYWSPDEQESRERFLLGYNLGINDFAVNYDFDFMPNNVHYIKYGVSGIYHHFKPGYVRFLYNQNNVAVIDTSFGSTDLYAPEFALYAEDDFKVGEIFRVNAGFRLSGFIVRNRAFISPEPRISVRAMVTDNISLKASYAVMKQYLHFLTNNTIGLPIDVWVPATDRVLPQDSWQASAGLTWITAKGINITAEGFYKKMNNLVELKEGKSVFSVGLGETQTWEDNVTQGRGWAYGGELLVKKDFGRLRGWIGYTLMWSMRQFADINFGQPFPFKYDRRHDISVVGTYRIKKNIVLGFTWIYGSGTPVTIAQEEFLSPVSPFYYSPGWWGGGSRYYFNTITYYGGRNSYRLPSYQRLDLSLNLSKQRKHGIRTWTIGVYNAYNHINPFFTTLVTEYENNKPVTKLRIYSIFPVMPFFSYKFTWN